ncbi:MULTISPECIES: shikimate 5-dehydrogenase [unclassified Mycolicibacterium]|uniref:shikimate 5-dehydrogenase n=1 Tax=unclassified Mycolicibacterium TaxID=2636767 RepID=UPI0013072A34|nr:MULTISPECIES: shikimate 5-dehydrogenase [unclassified Mycolicibacterium]MUL85305.1 shikimate 5-dehydrogenase [Mycolicibacterium sp. CBMA 329]MUL91272.1 shikimate 5-dehydrogenase [Mycolicibacterium sp. CBMA 331]MUM02528.1 shikimate 5-dehydrogenase [Mycolicibacterium sp. CBMA 334]MUM29300.1 shikimate 5-dehydrogenase [Mycolicibacterium sp. CBMA 295]MUM41031.1 shikimate 5-dehydrogenase [Mycolicibacterium sp. CBMA 247]
MSRPPLGKDTTVCISLAARPSNIGTRFHNYLYDELGLDYLYKAFTTTDIAAAIGGVRALGIRGCSVSMPFKKAVMSLVDEIEPSAQAIDAVNTIVNDLSVPGGRLVASNTDYLAVQHLIERLDAGDAVLLRGSGGMANAVGAALRDKGFRNGTVVARNAGTGGALAETLGYGYAPEVGTLTAPILVNVTPIGMAGGPDEHRSAFDPATIEAASAVVDVVAMPAETPLITAARAAGLPVITGAEVIALQAAEQFERYTGMRPTPEQVAAASAYSQQLPTG